MAGGGTTAGAVVPLATMIGGVCSADDPTAKVTRDPALCSAGRDGMIVAPTSPEIGLPAEDASMLTPLPEKVGLKTAPATVVVGMMAAPVVPPNSFAEVAKLPAFSATALA